MNVPFVKVNNQQEFERVVDKMQRETGLPNPHKYDTYYPIISASEDKTNLCGWMSNVDEKIISADEYLTEIGTNFTLSDLEDGMVVEYRNGEKRLFMYNSFVGIDSYGDIKNYNQNFSQNQNFFELDIVKIYKLYSFKCGFDGLFNERNLTLIFDAEAHRNKFRISQRKSEIENEMAKLQEELDLLEVK